MADRDQPYDPPQDTGTPDAVETDPAALNSAEGLDEDRLRVDPLEKGMDPPEHWSGADRRGTTPWEQANSAPVDERLAEEEPEVQPAREPAAADEPAWSADSDEELEPADHPSYDESLGTSADVAGGSVADEIRRPPPPD
ncbi:MAG TPA: hypothetical protein VHV49_10020 [Pseudonocardiaceae bacterium]|nr:hypothetical protein [Pseudonocardiaceae bacterium]